MNLGLRQTDRTKTCVGECESAESWSEEVEAIQGLEAPVEP